MSNKFKYTLASVGEGKFIFSIEEQPESLAMFLKSRVNQVYHASNGWKVAISEEPEVNVERMTIYLRGKDEELDDKVNSHWGMKPKEVKDVIKQVNRALEEAFAASKVWKPAKTFQLKRVILFDPCGFDPYLYYRRNPNFIVIGEDC